MPQSIPIQPQVFPIDQDTATVTLVCPHCGHDQAIALNRLDSNKKLFGVKCHCGRKYASCLEFRRDFRKDVELQGVYELESSGQAGLMTVVDVSLSGVGFHPSQGPELDPGDLVKVSFRLDTRTTPEIKRQVEIMNLHQGHVGARFTNVEGLNKELGFYLMY
ncbi:MAG: PilZ domain-containing protein [Desulfovibrio sp.]|nr:MAG: PilZ domain-containing protein [Desulfovibrio sp.]